MKAGGPGSSRLPQSARTTIIDEHARSRITDKLDDIVNDQWRDPDAYIEPLTGAPHSRLRIGQFRLGCDCDYERNVLIVFIIERRSGAYNGDDD